MADITLLFATMPNIISRTICSASLIALAAFLSLGMLAAPVKAQSIDTINAVSNGDISYFGTPPMGVSTVGQTITAPLQTSILRSLSFPVGLFSAPFPFKFYVFEWSELSKGVIGPALYVSPTQIMTGSIAGVSGVNVNLLPGKRYVVFASTSEVENSTSQAAFSGRTDEAYPGGNLVYTKGDATTWSSESWIPMLADMGFIATITYADPPKAPNLTLASRGNGTSTFNVNLSDSGSTPLKHYQVGCVPEGVGSPVLAESVSSPIIVSGLTNSTPYLCVALATNEDDLSGPVSAILSVPALSTPEITNPGPLQTGRINQVYSLAMQATGGAAPYSWSATSLPADLTINPATGIISGTPTAAGTSQVTITVTDDAGQEKTAQFTILVDPLDLTVPVENQTLPGGQVGQAYSASIVVAGGVPPYSFTLTGDLPEGLTLNPTTGAITGTPTKAQTSTFSITIEDSTLLPQSAMAKAAMHSVMQSFSITVAAAPVVAAPTPVPTLNDWGLLLLSALTIRAAGFFIRKRTVE
ncbi:MAG: Ig domain-containing protein [Burkholderiaceae bacterium]|nr:Ig domain-containing protein [Burkholderiaceae bacterium]